MQVSWIRRILTLIVITCIATTMAGPATSDKVKPAPPEFTEADRKIIDRNASLLLIIEDHPWTVKKFLDDLRALPEARSGAPHAASAKGSDPDIDRMKRASPEAAYDLFQIIKQSGSGGGGLAQ